MANVLLDRQNQSWIQQGDSQGAHNDALLNCGTPLWCSWTPVARPQGQFWDNLYVYQTSQIQDSNIQLDIAVRFRTAQDLANTYCFEFECHQVVDNHVFNGGWQARFDDGHWWAYKYGNPGKWMPTGIAINAGDFTPSQPTNIIAQYQRVQGGLNFLTLTVNGMCNQVNYTDPAFQKSGANKLNWAFQLDSRGRGAPINIDLLAYNVYTM